MVLQYERRGELAVLQLNRPPVNALHAGLRQRLAQSLERALAERAVRVVVLTGTGTVFSAGADIRELEQPAMHSMPPGELARLLETAGKPMIAAINGMCLGEALELALACHYRVATPQSTLGLPSIRLGLLPGAGGTQRLPRAVGADRALRMMTGGQAMSAAEALECGLVDRVVPADRFDGVLEFAREVGASRHHPGLRQRVIRLPAGADDAGFIAAARDQVVADADRGGSEAAHACVQALEGALRLPFEQGLALEQALYQRLLASPASRALRHLFFAERDAARPFDAAPPTRLRPVRRVGVVGCGTMGSGIAMSFADAGLPVRVFEADGSLLVAALADCRRLWEQRLNRGGPEGGLSPSQIEQRVALLHPAADLDALADADLVVEAVFEDLAVKQQVFRDLDRIVRRGAILASNTAGLDIDRIAAVTHRPQDVVGTRYFVPAQRMRLLEVVRGSRTADEVLATVTQLARRMGKLPVVTGAGDVVLGQRLLRPYFAQAAALVEEGATPAAVDAALESFGFAVGPLALLDAAGIDTVGPFGAGEGLPALLLAQERLGRKRGRGWYRYDEGRAGAPLPDPELEALAAGLRERRGQAARRTDAAGMAERCVLALVNEGARLLDQGVALRAADIDLACVAGHGFPAWRGGPMYYAQTLGLAQVLAALRRLADAGVAGDWSPARRLRACADGGLRLDARVPASAVE